MENYDQFNVRFLSILSYIGPMFLLGKFSVEKESEQVKFHNKQGEILFYIFLVLYMVCTALHVLNEFTESVGEIIAFTFTVGVTVAWVLLMIIGVSNAVQGKMIGLPVVNLFVKNNVGSERNEQK